MKTNFFPRILLRVIFTCAVVTFSFLAFLSVSIPVAASFSRMLDESPFISSIVGILVFITGVGSFYLWGHMIYHWGNVPFRDQRTKLTWFLIITLGTFLGAAIYYVVVYEKGRFLRGYGESTSS